ncbi:hypothetical protein QBC33DRAFT_537816 [Phialemonium atrogriseum]|uniref:Uncharacterized protein n=1 Tax=Phialemonium atrogriseum TaxID=1093897 RepID=A0AAJ0BZT3_9PEZI|nr:uncharacterized protein QBC33DRAFT_537816 [Phialemonium atrogriseum]KAK1767266.1 hypothetical protein QBC33DRAFT_537816 [Phialemonium atrogriseum]
MESGPSNTQAGAEDAPEMRVVKLCREHPTLLFYSLHWPLFEPITAIQVLDDPTDPSSQKRPFQNPDGTFHAIAALPITSPPVALVEVNVKEIEESYDSFIDEHLRSVDEEYEPEGGVDGAKCTCCGFQPLLRPKLMVHSSSAKGADITLRDYVTQLHAWLLSLEDTILRAVAQPPHLMGDEKRPPGGRFWVRFTGAPEKVWLSDEKNNPSMESVFDSIARMARHELEVFDETPLPEEPTDVDPDAFLKYLTWMDTVDIRKPLDAPGQPVKPPNPWDGSWGAQRRVESRAERRANIQAQAEARLQAQAEAQDQEQHQNQ